MGHCGHASPFSAALCHATIAVSYRESVERAHAPIGPRSNSRGASAAAIGEPLEDLAEVLAGILRCEVAEQAQERSDEPGPARLMAGPDAGAIVAMKVLVEEHEITPVRIVLEAARGAVDRPPPLRIGHEDADEPSRQLRSDFEQGHEPPGARRTFDAKVIAVVTVELQQRAYEQQVHRKPHRPAPVRIAAEHAAIGLGRSIRDLILIGAAAEYVWMIAVISRQRTDTEVAEEFLGVEHSGEHATQLVFIK